MRLNKISQTSFDESLSRISNASLDEVIKKYLKNESEQNQRDFELLSLLLTNKHIMLAEIDLIYSVLQKYYLFCPDFQKKNKLPVQENLLPFTLAFTYKYRPEVILKPYSYQNFHVFDYKAYQPAAHQLSLSVGRPQQVYPLIPYFRPNAPLGACVFLDQHEYKNVMKERAQTEAKFRSHLERLERKKTEHQEICTPIPAHPDRCFVCDDRIVQQDNVDGETNYKLHLKSQQHLDNIERNEFYNEIDSLIDELKIDQILKQKSKGGRRKKLGKGNLKYQQDEGSSGERQEGGTGIGSQEFTNLNFLSTEVTLAKQQHRKKQRIPQPYFTGNQVPINISTIKPSLDQIRLHQTLLQQQNAFNQQTSVLQKRKRNQLEEDKEEVKIVKFTEMNAADNMKEEDFVQQQRVIYQAKRFAAGTKTRKQLRQDQLEQQQMLNNRQQ